MLSLFTPRAFGYSHPRPRQIRTPLGPTRLHLGAYELHQVQPMTLRAGAARSFIEDLVGHEVEDLPGRDVLRDIGNRLGDRLSVLHARQRP